ncbi:hypothetical protein LguiA_036139 [Lonicera macranthoides]
MEREQGRRELLRAKQLGRLQELARDLGEKGIIAFSDVQHEGGQGCSHSVVRGCAHPEPFRQFFF